MTLAQSEADTVASLPGVEITTSVDRADMYVGDLVTYILTIVHDSTYKLIPPPLGANLGAFDVKDYQPDIVTVLEDGRVQSENRFVLSTFTTGDYVIPPIPVIFDLPDGTRKVMISEAVPVKVNSLLLNTDDSLDIKPLKTQYEFLRDLTIYYYWGGAIALVLLLVGLWFWRRLRKKKTEVEPVDLRPPWEIAFERLAVLQGKNLIDGDGHKLYYIELSEIARWYLGRVYQCNALDMTTEEFMAQFESLTLPPGIFDDTIGFLSHADLVKFAKLVPAGERTGLDFDSVHAIVERVRTDQVQRLAVTTTVDTQSDQNTGTPSQQERAS
ncbi:MAG: BatD family protein [candidate division Zixibacteria bacterium]|nr:BatD family protein [candidate division Zixibacteria bacterium]